MDLPENESRTPLDSLSSTPQLQPLGCLPSFKWRRHVRNGAKRNATPPSARRPRREPREPREPGAKGKAQGVEEQEADEGKAVAKEEQKEEGEGEAGALPPLART